MSIVCIIDVISQDHFRSRPRTCRAAISWYWCHVTRVRKTWHEDDKQWQLISIWIRIAIISVMFALNRIYISPHNANNRVSTVSATANPKAKPHLPDTRPQTTQRTGTTVHSSRYVSCKRRKSHNQQKILVHNLI